MITLEILYCKRIKDNKTYETWRFIDDPYSRDYGWSKNSPPNPPTISWFSKSNEEDLLFLEKEHKAFMEWYNKEKDEIKNSIKYN